ncbi:alpha-L-fucosidase [Coraliomargarita sp. SDUM461003]|uniref:alpha-L-fucosidase n=1 Tax=Thalassobacterium maritimum TaxID=3041265 RepID=A0ABU1ATA6_9BACT|nr:alpha-L-fucosidase [Coraliomargarita sp. SDUM461003]MDQ8207391.1 alpha-L-fucosidase [Coraliomargarita sp. SDUM461003]
MKLPKVILSLVTLTLFAQVNVNADTTSQAYDGSWESLQQMPVPAWFDDGKIGIFIHWGPYSAIGYRKGGRGYAEHVPKLFYADPKHYRPYMKERWGATPPEFGYKDIIPEFKAENWDPDAWAKLFKEVGAHYVVMTAEHHDGWANWDSDLTPWNAVDMGPKRDLVGDLGKALKKQGLKYAPSYHRERHQSFFAKKQYVVDAVPQDAIAEEIKRVPEAALLYGPFGTSKEFVDSYVARWKEIQEKYQPDMLWMDDFPIYTRDGNNVRQGIARPEVKYFDDQVRLMITDFMNDAASRGQPVYVNNKGGNRNWPDGVGCLEKDNLKLKVIGPKWQSCTTFGTSFGYLEGDKYKTVQGVIHEMIEVISRNGNFLINIGPKADGTIPQPQVDRLQAMGDWLRINGAAIYGSRYWKVSEQKDAHLAFTTNGTKLYAIKLDKPTEAFTITGTAGWTTDQIQGVRLLGSTAQIDWQMTPEGIRIASPSDLGASQYAWTFEIQTTAEQHTPNVIVRDADRALKGTKKVDLEGNVRAK